MSALLEPIAVALLDAFYPLDRALRDTHALRVLLRNLGWEKEFDDAVLAKPPLWTWPRPVPSFSPRVRRSPTPSTTAPRTTTRSSRNCST